MILRRAPGELLDQKEMLTTTSYSNHNGEKPVVGSVIAPKDIIFKGQPKEGQWLFACEDVEITKTAEINVKNLKLYAETIPIIY